MTTTHSLELFMTALRGQNYSPKILRAYRDDLRQFLGWVGENQMDWDHPKCLSRVDIEGFMNALAGQQMTGVTRVRKLAALRKFLGSAIQVMLLQKLPT
jgi:site-specific recombinase XerD